MQQTSRGKFNRLQRAAAEFTTSALDGCGLRDHLPARPAPYASYPVLVHRLASLLYASFRPRLTTTPLRFAIPSPPSGWIRDLHPPTVEHARHTMTVEENPPRVVEGNRSREGFSSTLESAQDALSTFPPPRLLLLLSSSPQKNRKTKGAFLAAYSVSFRLILGLERVVFLERAFSSARITSLKAARRCSGDPPGNISRSPHPANSAAWLFSGAEIIALNCGLFYA